jgi:hypothetical protein
VKRYLSLLPLLALLIGYKLDTSDPNTSYSTNKPSEILSYTITGDIYPSEYITVTANVHNPDGDHLSYYWTVNGVKMNDSMIIHFRLPADGSYVVALLLDDGVNAVSYSETIVVDNPGTVQYTRIRSLLGKWSFTAGTIQSSTQFRARREPCI